MNAEELKQKYYELYDYMAQSKDPKNMKAFGHVMNEMMDWLIANKPEAAQAWIEKLESIKWKNYLTPAEAEKIVAAMEPKAPWSREQWNQAMKESNLPMDEWPHYNRCALYTTMNMIVSDSSETLKKYVSGENLFKAVYDLAVDKLTDADGRFVIRAYFGL